MPGNPSQIRHNIAIHRNDHNFDIHVPDGIVNKTQAIECELTSKSLKDTSEVMKKLLKLNTARLFTLSIDTPRALCAAHLKR